MEIAYSSEPNYPLECALLIIRALCPAGSSRDDYTTIGIDDEIANHCALHTGSRESLEQLAAPLREVQDYVMAHLTTPRDRLEFFFRELPGDPLIMGWNIAFWIFRGFNLGAMSPSERNRTVYGDFFGDVYLALPDKLPEDEASLADLLNRANCSDATRWRFLMFSRHAAEYQREVAAILEEAKALFLEKKAVWQPVLNETTARLKQKIGAQGIGYMSEKFHLKLDGESFLFFPSLTGFNRISLSTSDQTPDHADIMYGIFVDAELAESYDTEVSAVCQNCKALGDQKRFEILLALKQGKLCGQEIAERTGLSAGTVSHHMNELVNSGFVTLLKDRTRVNYTLSPQGIERFFQRVRGLLL